MKRIYMNSWSKNGCDLYRADLPAGLAKSDKWTIRLKGKLEAKDILSHDAFIFHRIPSPYCDPTLSMLKEQKKTIVWELDDDLLNIPADNPFHLAITDEDKHRLITALSLSDYIIVPCEGLKTTVGAWIGGEEKIRICPNLVHQPYFPNIRRESSPVRIVWAGSGCHYGDLQEVVEPIQRVLERYGDKVQVVFLGDLPDAFTKWTRMAGSEDVLAIGKSNHPQIGFAKGVPLLQYFAGLLSLGGHIGLAPLNLHPFNWGKSNLKWLEYTMAGLATVASDVLPFSGIRDGVDGLKVRTADEWYTAICRLIEREELREAISNEAKKRVVEEFTWTGGIGVDQWVSVFDEIVGV